MEVPDWKEVCGCAAVTATSQGKCKQQHYLFMKVLVDESRLDGMPGCDSLFSR